MTGTMPNEWRLLLRRSVCLLALALTLLAPPSRAAVLSNEAETNRSATVFERRVALSKELGATHVVITEDIPPALWQFEPPDDPYPAWYVYRPSLLKIFPPREVQPHVNTQYADRIARIFEERCKILRKYGLKAQWNSNEPQVMPEAFFAAYPQLRGPRVDQPNRSRVPCFAPCVDQPETLRLYREAMKELLRRCPEIESFNFLTTDSGSGFCWVPGLYPGINGNGNCKNRPMEDRVSLFLRNLQDAAKEAEHDIIVNVTPIAPRQWMIPSFSPQVLNAIVAKLPRGLAVSGREGPDGQPLPVGRAGFTSGDPFYPVVGIVVPNMAGAGRGRGGDGGPAGDAGVEGTTSQRSVRDGGAESRARMLLVSLGDETTMDFNFRLLKATRGVPARNMIERLQNLRAFAVAEVGEEQADNLMEVWSSLSEVQRGLSALDFGGMLRFGHVLNRWVVRPMVPFPEELAPDQKAYYRRFLFQAKGEEQADDLVDIQAMRMYEGWGAKMLFQRVIEINVPLVRNARNRIERIRAAAKDDAARHPWELMGKRLEALICLMESADNMVAYQAHLDRIRSLGIKPEPNPVLGTGSDWARADMMETARKEIDNVMRLRELVQSTSEPLLDTASTQQEETIMRLGPDVAAQIKRKIDIMNAHWKDYDRLFTAPNP